tara:strand:- start:132 stop:347 length:216 start_codon:yes stop_codon:yes gene_type:complete
LSRELLPKKYMEYLGLGAEIAGSLLVPILLGFVLDRYFNITPIGILSGSLLGLILFFLMILRISRRLENED